MENNQIPQTPVVSTPTPPKVQPHISAIRTFQADVAGAVDKGKASLVTIAIAEAHKREREVEKLEDTSYSQKNLIILGISIFLIVAGIGVSAYLYFRGTQNVSVAPNTKENAFLIIDSNVEIDASDATKDSLASKITKERATSAADLATVEEISLTSGTGAAKQAITTSTFLNTLSPGIPGTLARSLGTQFVLGIHIHKKNEPFLLFKVEAYQSTFAGMLSWEEQFLYDFGSIFLEEPPSAADFAPQGKYGGGWQDAIVSNTNSRVVRDSGTNEIVLLYTFLDKNTLLITTNEDTLKEITNRVHAENLMKVR